MEWTPGQFKEPSYYHAKWCKEKRHRYCGGCNQTHGSHIAEDAADITRGGWDEKENRSS